MAEYTINTIAKDSDNFRIKDFAYQQIFTCDTAADVAIKEVTATNVNVVAGITIKVKFTYANTASSISLKVNGTAKTIYAYGSTTVKNYWHANEVVEFTYDGTYWYMKDISLTDEKVKQNVTDTSYGRSILLTNGSNSNGTGGPSTTATGGAYFAQAVYAQPSTGKLGATSFAVNNKVQLVWNSTDNCLDFVFL